MTATRFADDRRQFVHIAMGAAAALLRVLSPWEAAALASFAVLFNLYALPRIAPSLFRADEGIRRRLSGIVFYPLSVLLLIVLFPARPDIVAGAWGILAAGDGLATLVGRRFPGVKIPWNREKSVAGTAALMVGGGAAGAFLCWWCRPPVMPPPYVWFSVGAPLVAAVAAALVETIPIRLDDNLSVPFTAAAVLWGSSLVSNDLAAAAWSAARSALPLAIAVNAAVALAGYAARTVGISGAVIGAVLGTAIMVSLGWAGWGLLFATFTAAVIASRAGLRRKMLLGIAEGRGGRRGAANALANTGFAAAAAVLSTLTYASGPARLAFVAALAAGGSDTVASEIGKAWGRRTYLVGRFARVAPGTSGAVSIEGTAAGLLGAAALAGLAVLTGIVPASMLLPVVAGATIGSFAESALGATLEAPGFVNNDVLNFLNTAIAAAAALWLAAIVS